MLAIDDCDVKDDIYIRQTCVSHGAFDAFDKMIEGREFADNRSRTMDKCMDSTCTSYAATSCPPTYPQPCQVKCTLCNGGHFGLWDSRLPTSSTATTATIQ